LRTQLPMVMISHAAYPSVTKDRTPASLSKIWITDILRKRTGYRNLIVSDDLEMGGVLSAAPVGKAAVEFVRAGGDLCLICHREDYIVEAYEQLVATAAREPKFSSRAEESVRRVLAFKKKFATMLRRTAQPSPATVEKLSRRLWEFSEQVRLQKLLRAADNRMKKPRRPRA
jgi:beta-N-acetylhexosaminidase